MQKRKILPIRKIYRLPLTMAPAAARTISSFLNDTGTSPEDYNLILTGDLGYTGSQLLYELLEKEHNIKLKGFHKDCGTLIFDLKKQDVNSGGSGCGCSASVLCSHILKQMDKGILKKVLFVATGALMSPTSSKQGNSIPCGFTWEVKKWSILIIFAF